MPILWVAIALPILFLLQKWIHRHLHGLAFLITGNKNWAVILYAIILFPGVVIHELSHWIVANLLGVRTGSLSVLPKIKDNGKIQLGYVEYYKSSQVGPIRESLIGSAPLVTGTTVVLLMAYQVFDITNLSSAVQAGDVEQLAESLSTLFATADFLLWLYLIFAVSNAMMPSKSDRRAWPAFTLIMIVVAVVLYAIGVGDALLNNLSDLSSTVFGYLGLAFSMAIGVDLISMIVIHLFERFISRIKGVDLVYSNVNSSPSP
jgi:hypothetical protein